MLFRPSLASLALFCSVTRSMAAPPSPVAPPPLPAECTGVVTKTDAEASYSAFVAGKTSFDEAEYETAVAFYRDSYRRDCTKVLILDHLSRAYELKGDLAGAAEALDLFVKRSAAADPATEAARRRLVNLRKRFAELEAAEEARKAASAPKVIEKIVEKRTSSGAWPWVAVGAGGALFVGGVVLLVSGFSKYGSATDLCPTELSNNVRACSPGTDPNVATRTEEEGNTLVGVGTAMMTVGALGVAGGLFWALSEKRHESATHAGVRLEWSPSSVHLRGSF